MALIAGLAMAQVQSANTVGFVDIETAADAYTPVTVMLTDVGVNTLSIDSIVVDGMARNSSIQIFNSDGVVETELFYRSGWKDDEGEDASDVVFQPGDSFWVSPVRTDVTITVPSAL